MNYVMCIYCGHEYKGKAYPCPKCGPEEEAYESDYDDYEG